jgi:hypothetical protein
MDLISLGKLQRLGGPTLQLYEKLTAEADVSAYGSPASEAKAAFERDWMENPEAVQVAAEEAAQASMPDAALARRRPRREQSEKEPAE